MDLTNFPEVNQINMARSAGIPDIDTSSAADAVHGIGAAASNAAHSAEHKAGQAGATIEHIADDLNFHLPAYYAVGLWSYCEGQKASSPFSKCSDPSVSFSFDLLGIFSSLSNDVNKLIPQSSGKALAGYSVVSKWTIWAYILGLTSTVFAIVFGITSVFFSWGRIFLILSSIVSSGA